MLVITFKLSLLCHGRITAMRPPSATFPATNVHIERTWASRPCPLCPRPATDLRVRPVHRKQSAHQKNLSVGLTKENEAPQSGVPHLLVLLGASRKLCKSSTQDLAFTRPTGLERRLSLCVREGGADPCKRVCDGVAKALHGSH